MKKGLTELVFILDKSGSMSGLEADTIGGFNSMIAQQKQKSGEAYVSTVLFDDESEVIHDRLELSKVPMMTAKEYCVGGCTAMLDAIGGAIHHIGNIHKYARQEDRPEHTLFVITTDGMENSSKHFGYDDVKKQIERQKTKYGWEFLFLGANIDAKAVGKGIGISEDMSAEFCNDSRGQELNYEAVSEAVYNMRESGAVDKNWAKRIDEDRKARANAKKVK